MVDHSHLIIVDRDARESNHLKSEESFVQKGIREDKSVIEYETSMDKKAPFY